MSTSVLRPPAPPCASADWPSLAPAEASRIRCAAALLALLATVALQAGGGTLAPGLAARARAESLAAGLGVALAALPLLVAVRRRWPFPDVYRGAPGFLPLDAERLLPTSALALLAFGAWRWLDHSGAGAGVTVARWAADLLALAALYRAGVVLLDSRRVGRRLARGAGALAIGLAPSLALLAWTAAGRFLEVRP